MTGHNLLHSHRGHIALCLIPFIHPHSLCIQGGLEVTIAYQIFTLAITISSQMMADIRLVQMRVKHGISDQDPIPYHILLAEQQAGS